MSNKPIVVFEPTAGGHQMVCVTRILERARDEKSLHIHFVTTAKALAHPSAAPIKDLESERLQISLIEPDMEAFSAARRLHPVLHQQLVFGGALSRFVKENSRAVGHIFIPFFDAYFLWPAVLKPLLLGNRSLSGIVFRTRYHLPAVGIKTELKLHAKMEVLAYESILKLQKSIRLFTVDPYFSVFRKSDRLSYLRDPGDFSSGVRPAAAERDSVKERLGISMGKLVVLAYGAIDRRKALPKLLQAISTGKLKDVVVVVAGQQSTEVAEFMKSETAMELEQSAALIQIPRFVTDQEASDLFAAADLVWACYANADGSSGVLIKAGRSHRAAVVAPTGIISKMVIDNNAGWIADASSPTEIAAILAQARDNPEKRLMFARNLHQLFREHTVENFVEPIIDHFLQVSPPERGFAHSNQTASAVPV